MNCNVARDLLAGYNDNVLEEETKKELEEHLSECGDCKKINENLKTEIKTEEDSVKSEENIKPFKKVKKKLKHRKITIVILSVLILLFVGIVGYLTIGQIFKDSGFYSFELIEQDIKVKKAAEYFMDGNIDEFMKYMYLGDEDYYSGIYHYEDSQQIYIDLTERFKKAYDADFSGKKLKLDRVHSDYSGTSILFYVDDEYSQIDLYRLSDDKYFLGIFDDNGKYDFPELGKVADDFNSISQFDTILESDSEGIKAGYWLTYYITLDYDKLDIMHNKYKEFLKDGSVINRITTSAAHYDYENKLFYTNLCINLTDGQNGKKADYTVRFNIWNTSENKNGFNFTDEDLLNGGVREEKINELKDVYTVE